MKRIIHPCKALSVILWLVAMHSFIVGLGLIFMPPDILEVFGFTVAEKFFSAQGGVFHIVVCMVYIGGAQNIVKNKLLIQISIAAKFVATFFLLFYYFVINNIWVVLFSGLGDFLMGIIILLILRKCNQELNIAKNTIKK
ncbi:hypothetical protein ACFLRZ_02070 [Bacteroidota bacterium]